jgi:hypothetical protein
MNTILEKAVEAHSVANEFNHTLAIFTQLSDKPYAIRAPLDFPIPFPDDKDAEVVLEREGLRISARGNRIYCVYGHRAVITLNNGENIYHAVKGIETYFNDAKKALSSPQSLVPVCGLVKKTADICGCLTDINLPEDSMIAPTNSDNKPSNYSLISAIGAICIIYRRLSALRGFNFAFVFNEGIPSLAFSAKILSEGIESIYDLPEYPILEDLDLSGGITIYSRLVKLTPEDGEELQRLTIVLTPWSEDPRGILRAPEWKLHARKSLDMLDLDIPGRF